MLASRAAVRALIVLTLLLRTVDGGSAQGTKASPEPADAAASPYRGGLVSPPLAKPRFTLTDTAGAPFDFAARTQGYVTLLFFGYTHCPDMCPMQMHMIGQAFKKLPAAVTDQFKVVFVTTDPGRDSPQVMRAWLDNFDKRFIGLTGNDKAIDAAQIAANLSPARKSPVRPDGAYDVGHAAFVLAYTKDNLAHVIYPVGMALEDWVHDLPYLAREPAVRR